MAFDETLPANTTKIRNLGEVIRPNWVAIKEAGNTFKPYAINLNNRTPLGVSNDPTAIADANIIFSKDEGSYAEAFSINENSDIVQLTAEGYLGGATQDARLNNIRFGSRSVDYGINNVATAYVSWNAAGTTLTSFGCSLSGGGGSYTVTLNDARSSVNYVPIVCLNAPAPQRVFDSTVISSTTQFTISIVNQSGNAEAAGGYCAVFGGW